MKKIEEELGKRGLRREASNPQTNIISSDNEQVDEIKTKAVNFKEVPAQIGVLNGKAIFDLGAYNERKNSQTLNDNRHLEKILTKPKEK